MYEPREMFKSKVVPALKAARKTINDQRRKLIFIRMSAWTHDYEFNLGFSESK